MRRGTAARTAAVCRLIAGIGALVGAVVCALMVFVDIPYAVIVFPMVASVVTALWIVGWVIAASIHDMRAARSVGP